MASFLTATTLGNPNPNKSFEVLEPPNDSVSSLSFSPKANFLVATSWDNQVRCWEIIRNGVNVASMPKASIMHDQPVLCSTWKDDGMTVFSGGCDKQVKMWPLMSGGQLMTVAMHDAPIKEMAWIPEMSLLVTGSWDKTLKYWDTRQSNPVHVHQLPDRCYALTVKHPLMVVGTADRNLIVFNLQNPQTEYKRILSPLKYQTRCVAAFPDLQGFLAMSRCSQPIPCSTFNNDGSLFAYSVCYDWSKGAENHNPATAKTYIFLHLPQDSEVKSKPRIGTSGRK
ncbi:protein RAE1-like isoform X4 [Durio zibethinus]|uniref:Protein RAE1-like isoform X4 n=1 Tax=Durio zibethinus TaxID=66656 RepID=A0A6P5XB48_DURZI|nr:protein RAE1-like isoform X4 [Durio zibethinus]